MCVRPTLCRAAGTTWWPYRTRSSIGSTSKRTSLRKLPTSSKAPSSRVCISTSRLLRSRQVACTLCQLELSCLLHMRNDSDLQLTVTTGLCSLHSCVQNAMVKPLLRAKELLVKDINDHDDELDDPDGYALNVTIA